MKLIDGAINVLKRIGQVKDEKITVFLVPCAYELPLTVSVLVKSNNFYAIIALGTIIRGKTSNFYFIAGECSSGLSAMAINSTIPIAFGILKTENIEQAIERAGTKEGNKRSSTYCTRND